MAMGFSNQVVAGKCVTDDDEYDLAVQIGHPIRNSFGDFTGGHTEYVVLLTTPADYSQVDVKIPFSVLQRIAELAGI